MARARGASRVEAVDIETARLAHIHRHDYPEQRLQETVVDGERLELGAAVDVLEHQLLDRQPGNFGLLNPPGTGNG